MGILQEGGRGTKYCFGEYVLFYVFLEKIDFFENLPQSSIFIFLRQTEGIIERMVLISIRALLGQGLRAKHGTSTSSLLRFGRTHDRFDLKEVMVHVPLCTHIMIG